MFQDHILQTKEVRTIIEVLDIIADTNLQNQSFIDILKLVYLNN